jgi:hypothetical protein
MDCLAEDDNPIAKTREPNDERVLKQSNIAEVSKS